MEFAESIAESDGFIESDSDDFKDEFFDCLYFFITALYELNTTHIVPINATSKLITYRGFIHKNTVAMIIFAITIIILDQLAIYTRLAQV